MFGGGNPISRVELDNHINDVLGSGGSKPPEPVIVTAGSRKVSAKELHTYN